MNVLLDTNVLTRLAQTTSPPDALAMAAVESLIDRGHNLFIAPQNIYEFWVVCTRPKTARGLELTPAETSSELTRLRRTFATLPDLPALLPTWEQLVTTYDVRGKPAHDARLVAAMLTHGVTHFLTFNTKDFTRYPQITLLDPLRLPSSP